MNEPWWLWEGAAVRTRDGKSVDEVLIIRDNGDVEMYESYCEADELISRITPIENPAVMLAPEWAAYVRIDKKSGSFQYQGAEDDYLNGWDGWIPWPQCPDHLKGKTWELPR